MQPHVQTVWHQQWNKKQSRHKIHKISFPVTKSLADLKKTEYLKSSSSSRKEEWTLVSASPHQTRTTLKYQTQKEVRTCLVQKKLFLMEVMFYKKGVFLSNFEKSLSILSIWSKIADQNIPFETNYSYQKLRNYFRKNQ